MVIIDFTQAEIINIEGKQYQYMVNGIEELKNFDAFETFYIKKYYTDNNYKIIRTVVLYGGSDTHIEPIEVSFLLNKKGNLVVGLNAPHIFKQAIKNLQDYWDISI